MITTSAVRHSYYRQAMYYDISGRITDDYSEELQRQQQENYYQKQMEEEQRQYEQEQYEDELRRQQEQEYQRQMQEEQEEDYYQQQLSSQITEIKCTDSDGGKDYYTKGYITHTDGTKEYDECSTGAYKDYVWEYYCTTLGTGLLNYKCQYGCSDGACNSEAQTITLTVSYVSDGDTIQLSNGEIVRLIGLNAPECIGS